jgi:cytochrome c
MGFAGLKKPDERANLIAWLREQADSPAPLPDAAGGAAEGQAAPATESKPAEGQPAPAQ